MTRRLRMLRVPTTILLLGSALFVGCDGCGYGGPTLTVAHGNVVVHNATGATLAKVRILTWGDEWFKNDIADGANASFNSIRVGTVYAAGLDANGQEIGTASGELESGETLTINLTKSSTSPINPHPNLRATDSSARGN